MCIIYIKDMDQTDMLWLKIIDLILCTHFPMTCYVIIEEEEEAEDSAMPQRGQTRHSFGAGK